MNKISKLLLLASLALGMGLTSCNKNKDVSNDTPTPQSEGNTHISVSLKLNSNPKPDFRSLPDDNKKKGDWSGEDKIESITVFVSDYSEIIWKKFEVGDDKPYRVEGGVVKPKTTDAAIRTTPGIKEVFVVVNSTPALDNYLMVTSSTTPTTVTRADAGSATTTEGKITKVDEFKKKYVETLKLEGKVTKETSYKVETSASKLAKTDGTNGAKKDVIAMTNLSSQTITVAPHIKESETIDEGNPKNRVKLEVDRAVARVVVTQAKDEYNVPSSDGASVLGTITDVKWVLAQGENSFYVQRKSDYKTPGYDFVPNDANNFKTEAGKHYDYSGLFEDYDESKKTGGTPVPKKDVITTSTPTTAETEAVAIGKASVENGKFLLANTHETGENAETSKYKKGNTAYVLIRAKFKPAQFADNEQEESEGTFYVGANGKFYHTVTAAQDPRAGKNGVTGQAVAKYEGGKVLYYAWINPNDPANPVSSPVIRNNIYHIHIKGFKTLGTNWNPLFPDVPSTPGGAGSNLENPDANPIKDGGVTSLENPIRPEDPLKTPETYMSVEVAVKDWVVHSYEISLGI